MYIKKTARNLLLLILYEIKISDNYSHIFIDF